MLRRSILNSLACVTLCFIACIHFMACGNSADKPQRQSTSPDQSENAEGRPESDKKRDSFRLDSLWRAYVTELPDSLKFGMYRLLGKDPIRAHLNADGTFKLVFEELSTTAEGDSVRARAVWQSRWTESDNVFVLSRNSPYVKATGPPFDHAGRVDFGFHDQEHLYLSDAVSMIERYAKRLDTCVVQINHHDLNSEVKAVFLYPLHGLSSARPVLRQPDHERYFEYHNSTLSHQLHKSLPDYPTLP